MKKAYIEFRNGIPLDQELMTAYVGLEYLGYEIKSFTDSRFSGDGTPFKKLNSQIPVIGGFETMQRLFNEGNYNLQPIDYPMYAIYPEYYGREIKTNILLNTVQDWRKDSKRVFIKPLITKLFTGFILDAENTIAYVKEFMDQSVFVSPVIEIIGEWRVYVHKNKLVDSRQYKGDFHLFPSYKIVEEFVKNWTEAPAAYSVDLAMLKDNSTIILECNDFWGISAYGLQPEIYADMLVDRFAEIIQ